MKWLRPVKQNSCVIQSWTFAFIRLPNKYYVIWMEIAHLKSDAMPVINHTSNSYQSRLLNEMICILSAQGAAKSTQKNTSWVRESLFSKSCCTRPLATLFCDPYVGGCVDPVRVFKTKQLEISFYQWSNQNEWNKNIRSGLKHLKLQLRTICCLLSKEYGRTVRCFISNQHAPIYIILI